MDILLPYSKKKINLCGEKTTFFKICFFPFSGKRETIKIDFLLAKRFKKEETSVSDTNQKRLKFAGKLLFVCLLLGILYYSFRDSMGDMLTELANISPQVVMSLFLTVILYHIFEGTSPG